jgi:hypothetical protein
MDFPGLMMPPQAPAPQGGLLGMPGMDPQKMGLLAAAFQGLKASGNSRMPVTLGQTIGEAGNAGMDAMRQGQNDQMRQAMFGQQQQMQQVQMQQYMEKLKTAQLEKQRAEAFAQTLPENQRPEFLADPQGFMTRSKPVTVGRTLKDPRSGATLAVDETWQDEQRATREQRMTELQMRLADQRATAQERLEAQRELARMRMDGQREMRSLAASMGGAKPPSGYRFKADGSLEHIPGGPADPTSKTGADGLPKLTESQGKANLYHSRALEADKIISDLEGKTSPMAINAKNAAGRVWGVGGLLEAGANKVLSNENQMAEQGQRNFLNAILRLESGAVIGESEFDSGKRQYFTQPGDSKDVIDQKRQNRKTAIEGLKVMSGPAAMLPRKSAGASGDFGDVRSQADAILKGQ